MAIQHLGLDRPPSLASRARHVARAPTFVQLSGLAVAALVLLPVAYLGIRTFTGEGDAFDLIFRARTGLIILRSLLLVAIVTAGSVAVAVPIAWLTTRSDLPARRLWLVAAVLPLVIPSYVAGFVAVVALGPRGMLQGLLEALFGVERIPGIQGLHGAALVLILLSYPYVLITVRASMRRLDPAIEEAARGLGRSAPRTFFTVTLPLLRPAIAAGALLAALYTLSDFGAVSLLRYETFTWAIFVQYESAFDRTIAASLSLVLVAVALGILFADYATRGRGRFHRSTVGAVRLPRPVRLGSWRWPATFFVGGVVATGLAAPLSVLAFWVVKGAVAGENVGVDWGAAWNSVRVAGFAALAATVAALPVAVLAVRHRGRLGTLVERSTYIGFALPGIAVALALVFFAINYASPIYQTFSLLVVAYVVLFVPVAVGAIRSSLLQVSPRVEEAARTLGKRPVHVMWRVTLPLVLPGVLAGASAVFLLTMKELPATLILSPIGFRTLATEIWSFTAEAFFARAAAPALILVVAAGVPTAYLLLRDIRFAAPRVDDPAPPDRNP